MTDRRRSRALLVASALAIGLGVFLAIQPEPRRTDLPEAETSAPSSDHLTVSVSAPETPVGQVEAPRHVANPSASETSIGGNAVSDRGGKSQPAQLVPAPSAEKQREELVRNPHAPAPSYVAFAESVADRMEEAKADPARADELFAEIRGCADRREGATNVRAFCIKTARRLQEYHPDRFQDEYQALRARAPREVARILQMTE